MHICQMHRYHKLSSLSVTVVTIKKGWAGRIKVDGSHYRKSYISNYLDDIEELFQKGKKNSSDKMNPAQMRDTLIAKYPNRLRIPSETEIKQEIGRLFSKSKDTRSATQQKKDGVFKMVLL